MNIIKFKHIDGNANIKPTKGTIYAGPMSIYDIEEVEDRLIRAGRDYRLIEAEGVDTCMVLDELTASGRSPDKYFKGYVLLVEEKNLTVN